MEKHWQERMKAHEKKSLHEDIGADLKPVIDYVSSEDVKKTKQLIIKAIREGD